MKNLQNTANPSYQGDENLETMTVAVNYNNFLTKEIHKYAPKQIRKKVFDFGAGRGQFTNIWGNFDVDISAIEIDPRLQRHLKDMNITVTNLDQIPHSVADYIYSINVLEHIEDDEVILMSLFSRLKENGVLLIYVPAFELLWTPMDDAVGHVRRYSKLEIETKLRKSGFEVQKSMYVDCAGFFATLLMKLFMNSEGTLKVGLVKAYDRYCFPLSRVLDTLFFRFFFGKNIEIIAKKPAEK